LDGVRRWKRANRFGLATVPVIQRDVEDEVTAIIFLNRYREKTFSEKMREADIIDPKIRQVKEETSLSNLKPFASLKKETDKATLPYLEQGQTRDVVAEQVSMKPRTYDKGRKIWELKNTVPEIVNPLIKALDKQETTINAAEKEVQKQIEPEKPPKPFTPRPYTVWNFAKCDEHFGVPDFPGRIPGQIVQNVLHHFTNENDFVVDPMGGGGTTYDVCSAMNRRCAVFDVEPIRKEVQKHDVRNGFPEAAKNCDLIFLDPPYYKKLEKEERYKFKHIQDRYEWLNFMAKLVKDCHEALHPKGIVALLISDYIDDEHSILTCEYYNMFVDAGFKAINRIQTPLSTQQYAKHDVKKAKDNKELLNISRDLYIFRKV